MIVLNILYNVIIVIIQHSDHENKFLNVLIKIVNKMLNLTI